MEDEEEAQEAYLRQQLAKLSAKEKWELAKSLGDGSLNDYLGSVAEMLNSRQHEAPEPTS